MNGPLTPSAYAIATHWLGQGVTSVTALRELAEQACYQLETEMDDLEDQIAVLRDTLAATTRLRDDYARILQCCTDLRNLV